PVVERVPRVRYVARREDARRGRLEVRAGDDAVADLQAGVAGQSRARHHADADDGAVALDPAAAGGPYPGDRAAALERLHPVGERAQVADTVEVRPGDMQPARLGAGREQQPVVAEHAAIVQRRAGRAGLDAGHRHAGLELDLLLRIKAVRMDVGLLALRLTA